MTRLCPISKGECAEVVCNDIWCEHEAWGPWDTSDYRRDSSWRHIMRDPTQEDWTNAAAVLMDVMEKASTLPARAQIMIAASMLGRLSKLMWPQAKDGFIQGFVAGKVQGVIEADRRDGHEATLRANLGLGPYGDVQ